MTSRPTFWLRINCLIFAGILALQGAWFAGAELSRPILPYFPQDKAGAQRFLATRSAAVAAASIGWLRGDLWTDAAIALSSGLTSEVTSDGAKTTGPG